MKKKLFSVAVIATLSALPQFMTSAKADNGSTTTTTTTYYGTMASNSSKNPCKGPCDQVCKTIVRTTTSGNGSTVTTIVEKDGKGNVISFNTTTDENYAPIKTLPNGVVINGNRVVVTTTTTNDD